MFETFIGLDTAPLYRSLTSTEPKFHLLWGDGVEILERHAGRTKVRARGRIGEGQKYVGYVDNTALDGESLLEFYFIDVGQGDGVLIKTPDFRHIMIDGGWKRVSQNTGKNAADFVDWKFHEDYAQDTIVIDAMIASHNDGDHFGGLWDLLNAAVIDQLDCTAVRVKDFYHAGLAWWTDGLGESIPDEQGRPHFVRLMGERPQVLRGTRPRLRHDSESPVILEAFDGTLRGRYQVSVQRAEG